MIGVNLAGAEFGNLGTSHGTGYIYPNSSYIDYYADKGMELIRLPFKWERLQPEAGGQLDAAELGRIREFVDHAASKGLTVVLDVHNYGHYKGGLIGVDVPNSTFANLWGKLATEFKSDQNVWFGLMNEPHKQSAADWIQSANAAIGAIRDAGATQKIMVPGSYWSGSYSWTTSDNHKVVGEGVIDPLKNYAFEVHLYFDGDNSGTSSHTVSANIGVERVKAITEWAKQTGNELFLGEFGVARDALGVQALDNLMAYMQANADVWTGATYWAAGPWWGDYMFSIEPRNGVDAPQLAVLQKYDLGSEAMQPVPQAVDVVEETVEESAAEEQPEPIAVTAVGEDDAGETLDGGNEPAGEPVGNGAEVIPVQDNAEQLPEVEVEPSEPQLTTTTSVPDPVAEGVQDVPAPQSQTSTIAIRNREGFGDFLNEGESLGLTISVENAVAGQSFRLWMANSVKADDFDNTLEADLLAALPEGVEFKMLGQSSALITLKEGSYNFTIMRDVALDGVAETTDDAPWAKGNQEQVDFWISHFTGGLTSPSNVASFWIHDTPAQVADIVAEVTQQPAPVAEAAVAETQLEETPFDELVAEAAVVAEAALVAEAVPAAVEAGGGCGPNKAFALADSFFEMFMARIEQRADEWFAAKFAALEVSGGQNSGADEDGAFHSESFEAANSNLDIGMAEVADPIKNGWEVTQLQPGSSSFDWMAESSADAANEGSCWGHLVSEYA
jgi:endoglucanase